jgi:hypothetical protein
MNRLHRFLIGMAAIFLVLQGCALLLGIAVGCSALVSYSDYVFAYGTMSALIGILLWWTASRVKPARDRVTFKGHGGRVSLGVDVIERHLADVAGEFPSIRSLDSAVTPAGRAVDIELGVTFEKGTPLPDVTQALQERARESLSETMGPFAVRKIHVRIDEVGSGAGGEAGPPAAAEPVPPETP